MNRSHSIRWLTIALALWIMSAGAFAQVPQKDEDYQPQSGQPGKDVVWVPTPQDLVEKMLDLAKVTSKDYLIDLGSGDGRTVITAAKRGAHALGIEYNPDMVALSVRNAAKEGISDRASFIKADLFETDFSKATVITMFLLPTINMQLRPKLLNMKPGTRIVSNTFTMEDWQADATATAEGCMGRDGTGSSPRSQASEPRKAVTKFCQTSLIGAASFRRCARCKPGGASASDISRMERDRTR